MKVSKFFTYPSAILLIACLSFFFTDPGLSASAQQKGKKHPPPPADPAEIEGFSSPIRIAFGPGGNLLVTDYNLGTVVFVDPQTNEIKGGFPVDGKPLGVAYARKRIYVGNETKACISVYGEDGVWMEDITGGALGPIMKPTDLAVDLFTNQLFVLDFSAKRVKVFSLRKGMEQATIPAGLPDPTLLAMPSAIALDPVRYEVLISDYGGTNIDGTAIHPRIQIFDYSGNHLGEISGYSSGGMMGGKFIFSRPQGLQVSSQGHVVLTDCYSGEVLIISRETGSVLKTLGGYGVEPGEMRLPLDLVVDDGSGDVFVTNNLLKRIEIYRQGGIY